MDVNPVSTPMDPNVKLDMDVKTDKNQSVSENDLKLNHGYAQLISSLMYLTLASHPDIAYSVN